ncbi:MAG: DUF1553 domain-containing protein [Pirellulaceae bacterium]|nr:DUF1553 domain-containing protein [Pirellulaceae bacterium]
MIVATFLGAGITFLPPAFLIADEPIDELIEEPVDELEISPVDRTHWAYLPLIRPAVPETTSDWANNDIDRFILARLRQHSLAPTQDADRRTLIRRLYLHVLGIPPTIEQVDTFVQDRRPDAYRRVVDQLLASPEYGKRWGQHWLDLARFAETDGFEHDKVRSDAWRYRDWVVNALNRDMPYDRFVRWQIAGDLLAPGDRNAAIATAFCTSGPDMPDINSQQERRHVLLNEITSTVGAVFLSLQVGCAQCHDHKFDAISQADFYRLRAFFDSAIELQKNQSVTVLTSTKDEIKSHLMIRGDWRREGAELHRAFLRILTPVQTSGDSSSRPTRADLARWLTDPQNPITARSIVNRIWQHHFGKGLSSSPSDFGVMGSEPTHPLLLDYLAAELIDHDWSWKQLHRQILLSRVYQLRSWQPLDATDKAAWRSLHDDDPDNRWLGRFPRQRMDAEVVRDSLLAVSDSLNGEVDGPGVSPPLPAELIKTLKSGQWTTSERKADHYRRSIYLFARRNLRYPFLATLDRPPADQTCAARVESTTAVQSLQLMNSAVAMDCARRLSDVVLRSARGRQEQLRNLYQRVYGRMPSQAELADCNEFLNGDGIEMMDLCRALLNSNEFVYVD